MPLKEFIQGFTANTKKYIEKYEQYKDLTGKEKKQRVDDILEIYCTNSIDKINLNIILKIILKKLIIPNIPYLTQAVFDLIKIKTEEIICKTKVFVKPELNDNNSSSF